MLTWRRKLVASISLEFTEIGSVELKGFAAIDRGRIGSRSLIYFTGSWRETSAAFLRLPSLFGASFVVSKAWRARKGENSLAGVRDHSARLWRTRNPPNVT
jgi:hypothetical protein